jgi:hypothetical protein
VDVPSAIRIPVPSSCPAATSFMQPSTVLSGTPDGPQLTWVMPGRASLVSPHTRGGATPQAQSVCAAPARPPDGAAIGENRRHLGRSQAPSLRGTSAPVMPRSKNAGAPVGTPRRVRRTDSDDDSPRVNAAPFQTPHPRPSTWNPGPRDHLSTVG